MDEHRQFMDRRRVLPLWSLCGLHGGSVFRQSLEGASRSTKRTSPVVRRGNQVSVLRGSPVRTAASRRGADAGRRLRCCGRYAVPEVGGSRLTQPAWARSRRGPREYQSPPLHTQPTLIRSRTGPFQGHLFPRRHCFVSHGENENPDFMYLGEDCSGKRHFDCVGFVCRVLGGVLGGTIHLPLVHSRRAGLREDLHAHPAHTRQWRFARRRDLQLRLGRRGVTRA